MEDTKANVNQNDQSALGESRVSKTQKSFVPSVRNAKSEKQQESSRVSEKSAAKKSINEAEKLANNIIDRRTENEKKKIEKEELKKRCEQELNELKSRNREMKEYIKSGIASKKDQIMRTKKKIAKTIKEANEQRKNISVLKTIKSASTTPRPINFNGKSGFSKLSQSRVEEEKEKVSDAIKEIKKLEDLEMALINKLKDAYEIQKLSENKVAFLINHPVITTKEDLTQYAVNSLSSSGNFAGDNQFYLI